ncbi:MAG: hypothetical protein GX130_07880 [Candidatus Hydrogenedens sp.]|nr:hypothetical protein [Candidatus Hydrogenedens sp.]
MNKTSESVGYASLRLANLDAGLFCVVVAECFDRRTWLQKNRHDGGGVSLEGQLNLRVASLRLSFSFPS